ncbi:MAG: hypothetical protein ACI97A_004289 [Planctomycetota bacterium]|jgi:hypothetical protein
MQIGLLTDVELRTYARSCNRNWSNDQLEKVRCRASQVVNRQSVLQRNLGTTTNRESICRLVMTRQNHDQMNLLVPSFRLQSSAACITAIIAPLSHGLSVSSEKQQPRFAGTCETSSPSRSPSNSLRDIIEIREAETRLRSSDWINGMHSATSGYESTSAKFCTLRP